jgi:transposase
MVTIGSDSHKSTHTFVAVDGNGRELATKTVKANSAGNLEALRWAGRWPERRWALEDCRQVSRRLEADLLGAGEAVLRVAPKLTAGARKQARTAGKSDPIDALAVARVALREPNLPVARLDGPSRELRLLVDHREDLLAERVRAQNRLRWSLHDLEPDHPIPSGSLNSLRRLGELETLLDQHSEVAAVIARQLIGQIRDLTLKVKALALEISQRVAILAPNLLALVGCGALTAAKLVGEVAGIERFRSRAAFAKFNGTAPIPVWSGNSDRHRLNRGGNRQVNAALHRIAVTQLRAHPPAITYLEHRRSHPCNNTKTEAIRALRRRLSDEVYGRLCADERLRTTAPDGRAAAAA